MNEIIKPMSVIRQEFAEKLVNEINNAQLPLFVIEPILQNTLDAVKAAVQKQYEVERAQYEQQLSKLNEVKSNKEE